MRRLLLAFVIASLSVAVTSMPVNATRAVPTGQQWRGQSSTSGASLVSGDSADAAETRWYVYRDADYADNHGEWTNWMTETNKNPGDMLNLSLVDKTGPYSKPTAIRVDIDFKYAWAGIAVSSSPDYWGEQPGPGFDLSGAEKLVFWAKGERGKETIQVKVAIAGDKKYGDSAALPAATAWISLTTDWKEYELPLKGYDLKRVIIPFCFVATKDYNKEQAIAFNLDEIYFVMKDAGRSNAPTIQSKPALIADGSPDRLPQQTGANVTRARRAQSTNRDDQAYNYLEAEMDRWSSGTVVYDDQDSGGTSYFPSNRLGDSNDIEVNDGWAKSPAVGTTCLKVTYTPNGARRWAGVYWGYRDHPGGNWGEGVGRNLSGSTRLRGWIRGARGNEIVGLSIGGVNRFMHQDPSKPFQDSFDSLGIRIGLTTQWKQFEIPIPAGTPLGNVIGGFGVLFSTAYNSQGCVIYLDQVTYDNADPGVLRLVRSYSPLADEGDQYIRNGAFLYDNALALMAFLARGDDEGRRHARVLADSFVWAQNHDRAFSDGRWRNAYSCGPLEDPASHAARLPGWYDRCERQWKEDRYAVSSDVGNTAWAIFGLLAAHKVLDNGRKDSPYLKAAIRAGEWVEKNCRSSSRLGGYSGGFEGWEKTKSNPDGPVKLEWKSTEHNIDLFSAFLQLATATGDPAWQERALHARKFVLGLWQREGYFLTGVKDGKDTPNISAIPTDVQAWALLAMGHDAQFRLTTGWNGPPGVPAFLSWVEKKCRLTDTELCPGMRGYRFSDRGEGFWFEGAAHIATAYHYLGDARQSESILDEIARANPADQASKSGLYGAGGSTSDGAIYAAAPCYENAETGFLKEFAKGVVGKWVYPARPHVGATAWFFLARRGVNPYWFNGQPRASN